MIEPLVLASQSPRRAALLHQMGIPFEIVPSLILENPPGEREEPASYCSSSSLRKALDVKQRLPHRLILAADTVVLHGGKILGKPDSAEGAIGMLQRLSGSLHAVITGITLITPDERTLQDHSRTNVRFRDLSWREIQWYIGTGEWKDKAGAYGIQGCGAALVEAIEGCFYNVVGLPIALLLKMLNLCAAESWPPGSGSRAPSGIPSAG